MVNETTDIVRLAQVHVGETGRDIVESARARSARGRIKAKGPRVERETITSIQREALKDHAFCSGDRDYREKLKPKKRSICVCLSVLSKAR